MVYFCYIDESGTPQIPGNTSHYVLCGISIPVKDWKMCDMAINKIKSKYALTDMEIHTGWIVRSYIEQSKIAGFGQMSYDERRSEVIRQRKAEIFRIKKLNNSKSLKQIKKNYKQTEAYIHLTYSERISFIREVADAIGNWRNARPCRQCPSMLRSLDKLGPQALDRPEVPGRLSRVYFFYTRDNFPDWRLPVTKISDTAPPILSFSKQITILQDSFAAHRGHGLQMEAAGICK